MNKLFTLLVLFSIGSIRAQQAMDDASINEFKQKVQQKANTTKSILSDFTQLKHLDFLENDIQSTGVLAYQAPESVKWSYEKPFQYSVIFAAGKLFIDDEGKKSDVNVGGSPLFKKLSELIVKSVRGDMFDDTEFDIRYQQAQNGYKVLLSTKNQSLKKYIAQFVLTFDSSYTVQEVKMVEPSGDYTQLIFSNRKDNIPIDAKIFNH